MLAQESATLCRRRSASTRSTYLANHDWRGQIKIFREMYRERRDAMLAGLADDMPPGTSWTSPPEVLRLGHAAAWTGLARHAPSGRHRSGDVPGTAFYADGFGSRHMRLSYCYPTPERIREGTRRLGEVLAYETGVLETFGPGSAEQPGGSATVRGSRSESRMTTTLPTVVVLAGGLSHERDVSLRSGRRVSQALRSRGVEVVESDVDSSLLPRLADLPGAVVFPSCTGRQARTAPCGKCSNCSRSRSWGRSGQHAGSRSTSRSRPRSSPMRALDPARWPCRMKSSESSELRHSSVRSVSRLASR